MSPDELRKCAEAIRQVDAIFRLEGFEPGVQHRLMDEALLSGRLTPAQLIGQMVEHVKLHESLDGFMPAPGPSCL